MILFEQKLLGSRGFSLIPLDGLHAIFSTNLQLLLPTKFVVVYVRKQSRSVIFEWDVKGKGWYLYAGEYPTGWEKKVKVMNLPMPAKKGSVSRSTKPKPKPTKKGDDFSKTYSDIVPFEGGLPPMGNVVLECSPPPSTRTHFSRRPTIGKSRLAAPWPSADAPPSSKT